MQVNVVSSEVAMFGNDAKDGAARQRHGMRRMAMWQVQHLDESKREVTMWLTALPSTFRDEGVEDFWTRENAPQVAFDVMERKAGRVVAEVTMRQADSGEVVTTVEFEPFKMEKLRAALAAFRAEFVVPEVKTEDAPGWAPELVAQFDAAMEGLFSEKAAYQRAFERSQAGAK